MTGLAKTGSASMLPFPPHPPSTRLCEIDAWPPLWPWIGSPIAWVLPQMMEFLTVTWLPLIYIAPPRGGETLSRMTQFDRTMGASPLPMVQIPPPP